MSSLNLTQLVKSTVGTTLISTLKANFTKILLSVLTAFAVVSKTITTFAAPEEFKVPATSARMKFDKIDDLLGTIILTLQFFSLGIATIFIVLNGIKIMTSSDSHRALEEAKSGMFKVFIGCAVVFLAATATSLIFKATN
jgi:2-phospho-L-lactate guanylyltransferase (CobY/MobA/RfbA family)